MDVDPSQAATGDSEADAMTGGDPAADTGGPLGPLDVLFRTDGGAPLSEIQQEYGSDKPTSLMIRGLMKMAGADRFPAIADICAGLLLLYMREQVGGGESPAPQGSGETDEFTRDWTGDVEENE